MLCIDCGELVEQIFVTDKDCGYTYYKCPRCGGDNLTDDYEECGICGKYIDTSKAYELNGEYYCRECVNKYAAVVKQKIDAMPWEEKIAFNIKYDGLQI